MLPAVGRVRAGLFRLYGNKGGIVMNLRVHETSIAFINCHLAAHAENVETVRAHRRLTVSYPRTYVPNQV